MSANATHSAETPLSPSSVQTIRSWMYATNRDGKSQESDVKGDKGTASGGTSDLKTSDPDSTTRPSSKSSGQDAGFAHGLLLDMLMEEENKVAYNALLDEIDGIRKSYLQQLLRDDAGAQAFAKSITDLCGCGNIECLTAFSGLAAQFVTNERHNATIVEVGTQLLLAGAHLQSACDINRRYVATIKNLRKEIATLKEEIEIGKKTSVLMQTNNDMLAVQRNTYQNHAETLASLNERMFIFDKGDDEIQVCNEGMTKSNPPTLQQRRVQEDALQELAKDFDGAGHEADELNAEGAVGTKCITFNMELETANDTPRGEADALRTESAALRKRLASLNQIKHENVQLKKKLASANAIQSAVAQSPSASQAGAGVSQNRNDLLSTSSSASPYSAPGESFEVTAKRLLRKIVARGTEMVCKIKNQSAPTGRSWQAYQMAESLVADVHAEIEHDVRELLRSRKGGVGGDWSGGDEPMVLDLTEVEFPMLPGRHGSL